MNDSNAYRKPTFVHAARCYGCCCRGGEAKDFAEAFAHRCIRCCARKLDRAAAQKTDGGVEPYIITAAKLGLVEITALLCRDQGLWVDRHQRKAAAYAGAVYDPRLWALFPDDICPPFGVELKSAHGAPCVCSGASGSLVAAASAGCMQCCARHIYEAGGFWQSATALMAASSSGHLDVVRLLRFREAGLASPAGTTALMLASEANLSGIVEALLPSEAGMLTADGLTALALACHSGALEAVRLLLPVEGAVAARGKTPLLFYIAKSGNEELQRYIFHETDPEARDILAAARQRKCVCQKASQTLHEAADEGCLRCCAKFAHRAWETHHGHTALMAAVKRGEREIAAFLARWEARAQTPDGTTALMLAAQANNVPIVRELAAREAGILDACGRTALIRALLCYSADSARVLLPMEGNIADPRGRTPAKIVATLPAAELWALFEAEYPARTRPLLLDAHRSACRCAQPANTLIQAAATGCLRCVARLLDYAGRISGGTTALIAAIKNGHLGAVRLLVGREAGLRLRDGTTALRVAEECGYPEIERAVQLAAGAK